MQYAVFTLGLLLCAGALYLNYRDKRDYAKIHADALGKSDPQVAEVQLLVSDLSAELNQTAEKIVGELEAKAAQLRQLVEEAKVVAARLEATGSRSAESREVDRYQPVTVLPWDGRVPTISLVPEGGVRASVQPEVDTPQPVRQLQPVPSPGRPPSSWREREAAIQEMAGRGLDVVAIAKELNIGKGEVKLILDLKKASAR